MRLSGKTALVTGAGGGIGKAIARRLAAEGAAVAAVDINRASAEAVREDIAAAGGAGLAFGTDVTNAPAVQAVVREVLARWQTLDILVNCAGGGWHHVPGFQHMQPGAWQELLNLNINGTLYPTHAALEPMLRQKSGRIINLASIAATVGIPRLEIYSATKGAIVAFTKALAMELGPQGITVNSVSPGLIAAEGEDPATAGNFLGRRGTPDEVAALVAFLSGPDAAYITGADHLIDGGRVLGPRGA